MWSSSSGRNNNNNGNDNNNNNNNNNNRVSLSPSKSSSTCSSPSPFSPSSPNTNTSTRKSMEEVWKDINLASLHDHSDNTTTTTNTNTTTTNRTSFPGLILQDFFARPFNKDPPPPLPTTTTRSKAAAAAAALSNNESSSPLGDITASFGSLVPPKATMLSLNSSSGCDFQFLENGGPIRPNQAQHFGSLGSCSFGSSQNSPFDALGSPTPFPSFCKKRPQENDDNSDDRRHKRMIKNRESAARSRARKQAYTNELELEVAHLLEENAKLRRQLDKCLAASERLPKKNSLYRTSTAPF